MVIYYSIHIIIFIACLFELSNDKKTKRNVLFVLMIMITLFGGLRWHTGGDWEQYYWHFRNSSWHNIFSYSRYDSLDVTLEPLFVFTNVLLKTIFGTFWMYNLCIVAFIQYTYYQLSWKFSPRYPIIFYAFLMIVASNYFPVRAGFSLAVAYHAYQYIKDRNWKMYLLVIFIAYMVHRQCAALLPLYLVPYVKKWVTPITAATLLVLFSVASELFMDAVTVFASSMGGSVGALAQNYTVYVNEGQASKVATLSGAFLNILFLVIYLYVMKMEKRDNEAWYKTLLVGFLIYAGLHTMFKGSEMGELTRLASLFVLCHVILFCNAFRYFMNRKEVLYKYSFLTFFILYYSYRITKVGSGFYFEEACLPYRTIFDYNLF